MNAIEEIVKKVWQRVSNGICPKGCATMDDKKHNGKQCPTCKCVVNRGLIIQSRTSKHGVGYAPDFKGTSKNV